MGVEADGSALVSVVTIGLNAASALPLTLESILAQTYARTETLVLDGGSWDGTGDILSRYSQVIDRTVLVEDAGIYHAMNHALDHVTGDYVVFMNAGDQFYGANSIALMMRALEDDPDVFYGNHIYVDRQLELFRRASPFDHLAGLLSLGRIDRTWVDRIPCHQATFARADLLRRMRFDTRLRVGADHDLLFRAYAAGARMQYVDEIVCHYFGGGFSVNVGERSGHESAYTYRRHSNRPDLVDRFFFPAGSIFPPATRRIGMKVGGFLPLRAEALPADWADCGEWVMAAGAELLAPEWPSSGLALAGYNEQDEQSLTIVHEGDQIGAATIERGFFRLEVGFDRMLPPGAVLTVPPARTQPLGDRSTTPVGFAIRSFCFASAEGGFDPDVTRGGRILFDNGAHETIAPMLGHGWSKPEVTHTWSVGKWSELWVTVASEVSALLIHVSGNPHVPGDGQRLRVEVNGQRMGQWDIANGAHATVHIDCEGDGWRRGVINRIIFSPSGHAVPPLGFHDDRSLGLCLWDLKAV